MYSVVKYSNASFVVSFFPFPVVKYSNASFVLALFPFSTSHMVKVCNAVQKIELLGSWILEQGTDLLTVGYL